MPKYRNRSTKRPHSKKRGIAKRGSGGTAKRALGSRKNASSVRTVIKKSGPTGKAFGRDALLIFEKGVADALRKMSRRRIPVMIKTSDGPVTGIPVVRDSVVIVEPTTAARKTRVKVAKR